MSPERSDISIAGVYFRQITRKTKKIIFVLITSRPPVRLADLIKTKASVIFEQRRPRSSSVDLLVLYFNDRYFQCRYFYIITLLLVRFERQQTSTTTTTTTIPPLCHLGHSRRHRPREAHHHRKSSRELNRVFAARAAPNSFMWNNSHRRGSRLAFSNQKRRRRQLEKYH